MAFCLFAAQPASAETLKVGVSATEAFSFMTVDFADRLGIYKKNGVEVEKVTLLGSAKLHQAMIAGAIDIAVGSGSDFTYLVKGAPEIAVAAMAGPPLLMGFIVPYDSPAKTGDDLRGKKIGVSTMGSLTDWLAHRLAHQKGWKPEDLIEVTVGADKSAETAFIVTHQIDAMVTASASGLQLEETKRGRLLFPASDLVGDFLTHAIYASDKIVHDDPAAIRAFLKSWFETIAYQHTHRSETIAFAQEATRRSEAVETREYDLVMPMYSADRKFHASGLKVLSQSFADLKLLDSEPDLTKYYTEEFLPKM
jgi:ABC-type nitrate/sulfonate/bicarbonate transport system substrate-binding protein